MSKSFLGIKLPKRFGGRRLKPVEIELGDGRMADALIPGEQDQLRAVADALRYPLYATVLIFSGSGSDPNPDVGDALTELFRRGLIKAVVQRKALVLHGGFPSGIVTLLGREMMRHAPPLSLTAVAPHKQVRYHGHEGNTSPDPNASRQVFTPGEEWGDEIDMLFGLGEVLAAASTGLLLVVLAGGDAGSKREMLEAVRRKLPVLVIAGTGGLADDLSNAAKNRDLTPNDQDFAEIVRDGKLEFFTVGDAADRLCELVVGKLQEDRNLEDAWQRFADLDLNANLQQRRSGRLMHLTLALGLAATTLAVLKQVLYPTKPIGKGESGWDFLSQALIIIPIVSSILGLASQRFKQTRKWILLRAAAESVKREIYRCRAKAGGYALNAQQQLSEKLEDISRHVFATEVNTCAVVRYDRANGFPPRMYAASLEDDGFSYLSPDRYVRLRVENQLNYFNKRALRLDLLQTALAYGGFIAGGLGSYLAAVHETVWVALTTAVVTSLTTYMGYRQLEMTIVKYNQTSSTLAGIRAWWWALSPDAKKQQANIDALVEHTEVVLQQELEGWVQQMQNVLEQLYKKGDGKNQ